MIDKAAAIRRFKAEPRETQERRLKAAVDYLWPMEVSGNYSADYWDLIEVFGVMEWIYRQGLDVMEEAA